jgi:3-oxoacyl-[acyl-carrier protein] reductase
MDLGIRGRRALVAMFCSAQASYVTEKSLVVDGGIGTSSF